MAAQGKPDFSGHWILETSADAAPDVPQSLTVRQPVVRTDVHGAPMAPFFKELSVERQFVTDVRTETYQVAVGGGMVGRIRANPGTAADVNVSQTRFSVRWEGNRLVIDTSRYSGPAAQVRTAETVAATQPTKPPGAILAELERVSPLIACSLTLR